MFILNSEIIIVFPYNIVSFAYTIANFDGVVREIEAPPWGAYNIAVGPTENRLHTKINY